MDHVLECPSFEGVKSAVRSGLGIAIINRRNLGPGLMVSDQDLPTLPRIANVARTAQSVLKPPATAVLAGIERDFV